MNEETTNSGPSANRKWVARVLLWAAAIGILAWIFRRVPLADTWAALGRTNPWAFAAVAVGFSALTLLLDSLTHFWLFRRFNPPVTFGGALRARGESYLLLALGFLYGQGGMAYAMSRRLGKPVRETGSSVMFLMFNNLMAMMVFPTLALLLFWGQVATAGFRETPEGRIILRWLVISWPICLLLVLFFIRDWDNPVRRRLKAGLSQAFDQARVRDYAAAMSLRGLQVVVWCIFSWCGLRAFGIAIPLADLFLLGPIIGLASAIPTPGRLGTSQGAWLLMFQHQVAPAALVAFSLLWTVAISLLRWLIGAIFLALPGAITKREET